MSETNATPKQGNEPAAADPSLADVNDKLSQLITLLQAQNTPAPVDKPVAADLGPEAPAAAAPAAPPVLSEGPLPPEPVAATPAAPPAASAPAAETAPKYAVGDVVAYNWEDPKGAHSRKGRVFAVDGDSVVLEWLELSGNLPMDSPDLEAAE